MADINDGVKAVMAVMDMKPKPILKTYEDGVNEAIAAFKDSFPDGDNCTSASMFTCPCIECEVIRNIRTATGVQR